MNAAPKTTERWPSKDDYERAAKAHGWVYSPAHDGWVHDEEQREGKYVVQASAEDACWLHDITVD